MLASFILLISSLLFGSLSVNAAALPGGLGPKNCPPQKFWATDETTTTEAFITLATKGAWFITATTIDPFYSKGADLCFAAMILGSSSIMNLQATTTSFGISIPNYHFHIDRGLSRLSFVTYTLGFTPDDDPTQDSADPYEDQFLVAIGTIADGTSGGSSWAVISSGIPSQVSNGACLPPGSGLPNPFTDRLYILQDKPEDKAAYNAALLAAKNNGFDTSSLTVVYNPQQGCLELGGGLNVNNPLSVTSIVNAVSARFGGNSTNAASTRRDPGRIMREKLAAFAQQSKAKSPLVALGNVHAKKAAAAVAPAAVAPAAAAPAPVAFISNPAPQAPAAARLGAVSGPALVSL
ncbi:hypothetical protein HDU96_009831 [Phlyctochytrium bullatum]|nr:hypothetical protein HDU96_009831 [Phlyctochytrium bullatum]